MKRFLVLLIGSFIFVSCENEPVNCFLMEAYSGYPASFQRPLENIQYDTRYEFLYNEEGNLIRIDEYWIENGNLLRSITDLDSNINDHLLSDRPQNGDYCYNEDNKSKYIIRMKNGNAVNEGIQSRQNPEDLFLWSANYYDDHPNVLLQPGFSRLPIGRNGIAAINSKNNLIAWADLQGSGLVLNYHFLFNESGLLIQSQVPSGLTMDFIYDCP